MKRRPIIIATISCIAGLIVSMGYLTRIRSIRDEITSMKKTAVVLCAARPMEIGELITEAALDSSEMPLAHLPRRTILMSDMETVIGRRLIHPVPPGDPIMWTDLPEGPRVHYATERIPSGYRAMALPADEVHTLIHLLTPGDRVDILWTHYHEGTQAARSDVIGESIPVLAVGRRMGDHSFGPGIEEYPSSVTLLLEPGLAGRLATAMQSGEITLLGRGRGLFPSNAAVETTSGANSGER